jgi:DNA-binding NarL/FixJ family response regulator
MDALRSHTAGKLDRAPWGMLPPRMKVLYVAAGDDRGGLAEAFAADSASQVCLQEVSDVASGMALLREEAFDAVLVRHLPGQLDAIDFLEGLRAAEADEPVVVLWDERQADLASLCCEAGADGQLCLQDATVRALIWTVARAVERRQLIRENRRLTQAEQQRAQHEHMEAGGLIEQQRALLDRSDPAACTLPDELVAHYRELLRAHVMMGSGNLAAEMDKLADLLVSAGVSGAQAIELHVEALEGLVRGLGQRSTRHILLRSDLLALDVLLRLAEGYRLAVTAGGPNQTVQPSSEAPSTTLHAAESLASGS